MADLDTDLEDRYLNSIPMITSLISVSVSNLRDWFKFIESQIKPIADTDEELKFNIDFVNSTIEDLSKYTNILLDEIKDPDRIDFLNYYIGRPTNEN